MNDTALLNMKGKGCGLKVLASMLGIIMVRAEGVWCCSVISVQIAFVILPLTHFSFAQRISAEGLNVYLQAAFHASGSKRLLYWMFSNLCQQNVDVIRKWSTKGYHDCELIFIVFPPSHICLAPFFV